MGLGLLVLPGVPCVKGSKQVAGPRLANFRTMHGHLDHWSLAMIQEIVARVDADQERHGLERAKSTALRWYVQSPSAAIKEWLELLERPWEEIRQILLDESDEGQRLRSNAPFCGTLSPLERIELFRRFRANPRA